MEFVQHSVAWCRGEIFEGRMLSLFGAVIVAVAVVFWRVGSTPSARAMFVQSERERTEAFIKWYPYTMYTFSVVILLGIGVFLWKPTPLGRAIGLATLIMGLGVLFLDHFSEERAEGYHTQIIEELNRRPPGR